MISSFIQAIQGSPDTLIMQNMQEISYLQPNEKLLYYTDGRIRREYDTYWRSIRPYTGINYIKEYLYPEIPFDERIDNLKDFADFTWDHISKTQLGLRTAIAMQDIMRQALSQLETLKDRYEAEKKPHNVTVVTLSITKIQASIQHLTLANKNWDKYLTDSVQEILASLSDQREQIHALWAKVKLYGAPEDMQLIKTGKLAYVCGLIALSKAIPDQLHGEALCGLLLKAYTPGQEGEAFMERLKRVYRAIDTLHKLAAKGQLMDPNKMIEQEKKYIVENGIFPAELLQ